MEFLLIRRFNLHITLGLMILLLAAAGGADRAAAAQPVTIWAGAASEHAVALTFDDGPSPLYTPQILDLLEKHEAHGTFFVMGRKVEKYPRLIKEMLGRGHEVGNHSFSHPYLTEIDQRARQRELETTRLDLDLLGCPQEHLLIRPPFSAFDDRLVSYAAHTGRQLVLWSIDSGDWRGLDARAIEENVLERVQNGAIIIFHDSDHQGLADRSPTVEALRTILPALKTRGYRLLTVSELMAENNP